MLHFNDLTLNRKEEAVVAKVSKMYHCFCTILVLLAHLLSLRTTCAYLSFVGA